MFEITKKDAIRLCWPPIENHIATQMLVLAAFTKGITQHELLTLYVEPALSTAVYHSVMRKGFSELSKEAP